MQPGLVLEDRFQIDRVAGSGGAGVVYRGVDRQTGVPVAIKVMRTEAADDRRFRREAETLAALHHPGIVSYLGHGSLGDELYLVMEWLEGEDLGTRLRQGPGKLDVDETVGVARQVAAALAFAHARGIVHRDVKPSNVFLVERRTDRVKLLDFGIARLAGTATLTATGMVVGTPIYMAPEQARGASDLDARVDVYALGALMFRCLAGRPPFLGESIHEVIAHVLAEKAPRLAEVAPEVSGDLDSLVARMLDKDPARRFVDGAAVHAALVGIDVTSGLVTPQAAAVAVQPYETRTASSIAVLPFVDLSAARDQEYLCDGVAEELINALTHVEGLRVAARSSSFRFKSSPSADAREIGARLGVDAVLEGGLRRAGDRLRVTVQLVDVATGYQRWSHRFDGNVEDVFAIQDEIAGSVATALRGILSRREKDALRRPGTSAEAYAYYLRGREFRGVSAAGVRAALELFELAIAVDPAYAPAYAGVAQLQCRYFEWGGGGELARAAADRASRKALELAPELADSHVARGHVHRVYRRYEDSEREFQEAIRINPNSFDAAKLYALMSFEWGKIEQAAVWFRRGADIRLEDCQCSLLLAQTLRKLGRLDEALEAGREGYRRAERQLALQPDDARNLSLAATALYEDGQVERAHEMIRRALAVGSDDPGVLYNVGCTYASMGDKTEALRYLEQVFAIEGMGGRAWVETDPELDSLRDDPRFQRMVARLM